MLEGRLAVRTAQGLEGGCEVDGRRGNSDMRAEYKCECKGSFCTLGSNNSLASKIPRFTWLPTPVWAHCSTPAHLQLGGELGRSRRDVRASGHTDTDGGSPRALNVVGLAGVDARVPGPGPLPHTGCCLPPAAPGFLGKRHWPTP